MGDGLMLAARGQPSDIDDLQARGFRFDLKVDGIRCFTSITQGKVVMESRRGENIADRYPEVAEAVAHLDGWTFDGELAVHDGRGLPSWPLTHQRHAMSLQKVRFSTTRTALPVFLHVFDLLMADHVPLGHLPYLERRARIDEVAWPAWVRPVLHSEDGRALWDAVATHRLEGMVAKDPTHKYRVGRHSSWLKIKRTSTVTCLVGGFDPGEGSRASSFGALHLYLLDGASLKPVGKVGSGFSEFELRQVMRRLDTPPLIVEVEFLDVSPDGQLRQPVFQRIRDDVSVEDCTIHQLKDA